MLEIIADAINAMEFFLEENILPEDTFSDLSLQNSVSENCRPLPPDPPPNPDPHNNLRLYIPVALGAGALALAYYLVIQTYGDGEPIPPTL